MPNDPKTPPTRRIDLSNCKLLSTYGRNPVGPDYQNVKIGILVKTGALVKLGILVKVGLTRKSR
jgi:hypothetical protein